MRQLYFALGIIIILLIPQDTYSQIFNGNDYNTEEEIVINTLLNEIIDADRLWKHYKDIGPMILYFNTNLSCGDWDFSNVKREYDKRELLRRLDTSGISERIVDSMSICNLKNILIRYDCSGRIADKIENDRSIIGEVSFSRISFNQRRTIGYFYYRFYCGEDCGWGGIVRIIKENDRWKIARNLLKYVS